MNKKTYKVISNSPIFCYGANQNEPEIRSASIRGHLRYWFKKLRYENDIDKILGAESCTSKIIVRVDNINGEIGKNKKLPHKKDPEAYKFNSYNSGTTFDLHIIERHKLEEDKRKILYDVIEAWLMFGALGSRSTRGGGSIADATKTWSSTNEWQANADKLLQNAEETAIIDESEYEKYDDIRRRITDTISSEGNKGKEEDQDIVSILGSAKTHKASPLKLKVIKIRKKIGEKIEEKYHIAAILPKSLDDSQKKGLKKLIGKKTQFSFLKQFAK